MVRVIGVTSSRIEMDVYGISPEQIRRDENDVIKAVACAEGISLTDLAQIESSERIVEVDFNDISTETAPYCARERWGPQMIGRAYIIPTGDEIKNGTVLDLDSPRIMESLVRLNPEMVITRLAPVVDVEANIVDTMQRCIDGGADLIVLVGGSGGRSPLLCHAGQGLHALGHGALP